MASTTCAHATTPDATWAPTKESVSGNSSADSEWREAAPRTGLPRSSRAAWRAGGSFSGFATLDAVWLVFSALTRGSCSSDSGTERRGDGGVAECRGGQASAALPLLCGCKLGELQSELPVPAERPWAPEATTTRRSVSWLRREEEVGRPRGAPTALLETLDASDGADGASSATGITETMAGGPLVRPTGPRGVCVSRLDRRELRSSVDAVWMMGDLRCPAGAPATTCACGDSGLPVAASSRSSPCSPALWRTMRRTLDRKLMCCAAATARRNAVTPMTTTVAFASARINRLPAMHRALISMHDAARHAVAWAVTPRYTIV
mmetsp:Transcript_4000/g.12680  ORF Transcript_4000/g.12680 Transcript_4000/m.12680 type:complete len:321 (+) Transcript_4000:290-1252(+)